MCILWVYNYYTLLKYVSQDLSVLSMSVMGPKKTNLDRGGVSSIQFKKNLAKPLTRSHLCRSES